MVDVENTAFVKVMSKMENNNLIITINVCICILIWSAAGGYTKNGTGRGSGKGRTGSLSQTKVG
jgi:hypothetical protein